MQILVLHQPVLIWYSPLFLRRHFGDKADEGIFDTALFGIYMPAVSMV